MRITNKLGLPDAIVNAVKNDPYDRGDCDISVTQLIGPPQIRRLFEKHAEEVSEDASDRIWTLLGQSVHTIIERAGGLSKDTIEEYRLKAQYSYGEGSKTVSGQIDLLDIDNEALWDFKVTSVWAIKDGVKDEWKEQLNVLADLVRQNGGKVSKLFLCAILRDWSKFGHQRNADYPTSQVVVLPVPLSDEGDIIFSIETWLEDHFEGNRPCTDTEIWKKDDVFAVKKVGRKSAIKLYDDRLDALNHIGDNECSNLYIEDRPGENVRCEHYCSVRDFCPQYKASKEVPNEAHSG